jgi:hypothetical protein
MPSQSPPIRHRKPDRNRSGIAAETPQRLCNPATSEVEYTDEECELITAVATYRAANHRDFPTLREVLAVLKSLGYRKVAAKEPLPRFCKGARVLQETRSPRP